MTVILTAILSAVGFYYFPLISDDLYSLHSVKESFLYGSPINLTEYWANIKGIFYGNHFRLPNLLMPWFMLQPRCLHALLSGIAIYLAITISTRIGGFEKSISCTAVIIAAIVFLFPWNDQLYLTSFQAPYLWGAALALWLLYKLLHNQGSCVLIAFMSWLTGFWLEAYAGALLGALICLYVFYPKYRTNVIICGCVGLATGILCCAAPLIILSKWTRWTFFEGRMTMIYPYILINALYLIIYLILIAKRHKSIIEPVNLSLLEISIASALICIYFKTGARINGLGIICSAIGICRLMNQTNLVSRYSTSSWLFGVLLLSCSWIHLVAVDRMCRCLGKETEYVVTEFRNNKEDVIFAPMTFREDVPFLLLQKPYYDWFSHGSTLAIFNLIYGEEDDCLKVVPEVLKDFQPENAQIVDGNAEIMLYQGLLVSREDNIEYLSSDYGRGTKMRPYHTVRFTSTDGHMYTWLHLENTWLDQLLHPEPVHIDKAQN